MSSSWTESGIVTDVINDAPTEVVQVKYGSDVEVKLGNELKPSQVQEAPTLEWPHKEGELYTVIMSDPDAPSRQNPKFGEWMHWLIVNVPGNDIKKGEELVDYMGSAPPKGTGLHRYAFFIYKQSEKLSAKAPSSRPSFKTKEWTAKYGLDKPLAGNFYYAQHNTEF